MFGVVVVVILAFARLLLGPIVLGSLELVWRAVLVGASAFSCPAGHAVCTHTLGAIYDLGDVTGTKLVRLLV